MRLRTPTNMQRCIESKRPSMRDSSSVANGFERLACQRGLAAIRSCIKPDGWATRCPVVRCDDSVFYFRELQPTPRLLQRVWLERCTYGRRRGRHKNAEPVQNPLARV